MASRCWVKMDGGYDENHVYLLSFFILVNID